MAAENTVGNELSNKQKNSSDQDDNLIGRMFLTGLELALRRRTGGSMLGVWNSLKHGDEDWEMKREHNRLANESLQSNIRLNKQQERLNESTLQETARENAQHNILNDLSSYKVLAQTGVNIPPNKIARTLSENKAYTGLGNVIVGDSGKKDESGNPIYLWQIEGNKKPFSATVPRAIDMWTHTFNPEIKKLYDKYEVETQQRAREIAQYGELADKMFPGNEVLQTLFALSATDNLGKKGSAANDLVKHKFKNAEDKKMAEALLKMTPAQRFAFSATSGKTDPGIIPEEKRTQMIKDLTEEMGKVKKMTPEMHRLYQAAFKNLGVGIQGGVKTVDPWWGSPRDRVTGQGNVYSLRESIPGYDPQKTVTRNVVKTPDGQVYDKTKYMKNGKTVEAVTKKPAATETSADSGNARNILEGSVNLGTLLGKGGKAAGKGAAATAGKVVPGGIAIVKTGIREIDDALNNPDSILAQKINPVLASVGSTKAAISIMQQAGRDVKALGLTGVDAYSAYEKFVNELVTKYLEAAKASTKSGREQLAGSGRKGYIK